MKQYEYVRLEYSTDRPCFATLEEHRETIDRYAAKGYRYVGMIPTVYSTNGFPLKVDLIFEQEG